MKLYSAVFPKDDSIAVLETLCEKRSIQIQSPPGTSSSEIPFGSESAMLQELLADLSQIQTEFSSCNKNLKIPFLTETQSKFLADQAKASISQTSMTKFLHEKKNQISRILSKINIDVEVIGKLRAKLGSQIEFICLMQSIYREFNQGNSLFSGGAPECSLRNSLRGSFDLLSEDPRLAIIVKINLYVS